MNYFNLKLEESILCIQDVVVTSDSLDSYEYANKVKAGNIMQCKYFELDNPLKVYLSIPKFYFVQNSKLYDHSIKELCKESKERNLSIEDNIADI